MATVIKSGNKDGSIPGIAYDLTDMADQANGYLEEVRAQARQIIQDAKKQAQKEADQIRTKAREEGLRDADKLVAKQLEQPLATLTPALKKAISEIEKSKQAWILHWENAAIALAVAVAGRIIGQELEKRPELPLEFVRQALELTAGKGHVVIRLNPKDHETLQPQAEMVLGEFRRSTQDAELIADPAVEPGGCRVETEFGSIDQQIRSQLKRIQEELTG